MADSREEALRQAYAACRDAETAWGGPNRGSADCRATEEMNATASDIGEAMMSLRRAAWRFGIDLLTH